MSLQDLMDTLTAYAEALGYLLKSPTFVPGPGDGWVLSRIDLRVRMAMFEEEPTPVDPAILEWTRSLNDTDHVALVGSLDDFAQPVKRAVRAIEPPDLL